MTNLAHAHSTYVHQEKVLTFWLRNSIKSQYKESPTASVLKKKIFWKISQNSQENTCTRVSFLIRMTPAQIFSCEFCEIFKTTVFTEHLRATTSDHTLFKRKTSTFRTKTLRINTSEIMALIKKSRYLPHFLEYRKNNLNGSILGSYKGSLLKLQTSHRRL